MSDSQSEKSRSSKRRGRGCFKWFLIVIGVFIGLFIIVVLLSGSPKENAATDRSAVVEITMESTQERPTSDTVPVSVATANNALSDEPDPTETSAPTATPVPEPTEQPWYSGGTLQKSNIEEWQAGNDADKLATVSDWYVVARELKGLVPEDEPVLRAIAESMVTCIDELVPVSNEPNTQTASIALLCSEVIFNEMPQAASLED